MENSRATWEISLECLKVLGRHGKFKSDMGNFSGVLESARARWNIQGRHSDIHKLIGNTYSDETLKSAGRLKFAGVFYPQTGRLKCVGSAENFPPAAGFLFSFYLLFTWFPPKYSAFFRVADLSVFWIFSRPPTGRLKGVPNIYFFKDSKL